MKRQRFALRALILLAGLAAALAITTLGLVVSRWLADGVGIGPWSVVGLAVVAVVVAAATIMLLLSRLYRPLQRLESSLERLAQGDWSVTAPEDGDDEFGHLGLLLNQVTAAQREREGHERRRREGIIERYGRIIDDSSSEIYLLHPETLRILEANRGARRGTGYDPAALRTRTALDLWSSLARDDLGRRVRQLRDGTTTRSTFTADQSRIDGTTYPVEVSLQYAPGDQPAVAAIVSDLTELRRVEHLNERLARAALHGTQALQTTNLRTVSASINEMAADALGVVRASVWRLVEGHLECVDLYRRDEHRHENGTRIRMADVPSYARAIRSERVVAALDAQSDGRTAELRDYYSTLGITSILDAPIRVGGQLAGVVCFEHVGPPREWSPDEQIFAGSVADIASLAFEAGERRRAEASLRESEQRYRTTFMSAPVGILEADSNTGAVVTANEAFCRLLGLPPDEIVGRHWSSVMRPEDAAEAATLLAAVRSGEREVLRREWCFTNSAGESVWTDVSVTRIVSANGRDTRYLIVANDISAQRALHEQLSHAQRMESIGQLAGGVAHDFNNILTAILGYVDLCRAQVSEGDPMDEELAQIERAGQRAADLTRQLLTFARRQVVEPRIVDLNEVTQHVEKMMRRLIGEHVDLVLRLDPDLGTTRIDPGQFEQVIVNLAVNARDAMPSGGRITIATRQVEVQPGQFGPLQEIPPGPYVAFSVSDTGGGMTDAVMARAFEPFFTTKSQGKGTGLGLATCYGIVRQAGGHLTLESSPGHGTTVTCYLPRVDAAPDALTTNGKRHAAPGRGETVLVVEDELQVRKLIERALRRSGYAVLVAPDGEEAVRLFREQPDRVDLVITDLVMPLLSGPEVIAALRRDRPGLPAICMSGYSEHAGMGDLDVELLSKPFQTAELTARVRRLLDGAATG
jgi:PAS domain S-box-containing protein